MLCSLLQLARRLIKHELGEQHSIYRQQQPRIRYNSTMEIGKVHDERKYRRQRLSTTPGGSEPTKTGSEKRQSHKRNKAAAAV